MLIVKRNIGERIFIGDDIIVMLGDTGRGFAKIGIDAPENVKILREEIAPTDHPLKAMKGVERGSQIE